MNNSRQPHRCSHRNSVIAEEVHTWLCWQLEDGAMSSNWVPAECPTGRIRVCCDDCGYDRTFASRRALPKWALRLLSTVDDSRR